MVDLTRAAEISRLDGEVSWYGRVGKMVWDSFLEKNSGRRKRRVAKKGFFWLVLVFVVVWIFGTGFCVYGLVRNGGFRSQTVECSPGWSEWIEMGIKVKKYGKVVV